MGLRSWWARKAEELKTPYPWNPKGRHIWGDDLDDYLAINGITFREYNSLCVQRNAEERGQTAEEHSEWCRRTSQELYQKREAERRARRQRNMDLWPKDKPFRD